MRGMEISFIDGVILLSSVLISSFSDGPLPTRHEGLIRNTTNLNLIEIHISKEIKIENEKTKDIILESKKVLF